MRILVIGAGATGGFYGGRLAHAGRDVTFLVRERRAAQLRKTGLMVRTPKEEFTLTPKLISAEELKSAEPFDLILLSVKAYAFDSAVEDFAPAVGPETMILPVLNGMRHLDALDARFGSEHVLGGFCRIIGDTDSEGRVLQMTELSDLFYGERDKSVTARIQAVDAEMQSASFTAKLAPDILEGMWGKWMMMAAINTINPLGRGSVGEIESVRGLDGVGARFLNRAADEAFAVAAACGFGPHQAMEKMIRGRLTEPGSGFESSLYRDLTRGLPVEADQIVGDMILRGRARGVETPLLEAAYVQLKVYEQKLTSKA